MIFKNALESKMQVTTPHEESASTENPSTLTRIVQSPPQLPTISTPSPEMPPPPTRTTMYSPYETSELYVDYMKKEGMDRLKLLQLLCKYAGNRSKANVYRKIKEFKSGKLDVTRTWNDFGRPKRLESISEPIKMLINKERAVHGHNVPIRIVRDIAKEAIHQEWLDKGGEGEYKEPCRTTIETYAKRVLAVPSVNINKSVTNKNETRYSAENSVRSSIAYSMAVATQHWWKGKPKKGFHLMDDDDMCKGARIGRELAHEFHGTKELQHVLPGLITSSDGTTFFCTVGQVEEKEKLYITINPPKDTTGTSADSSYRSHSSTARHGDRHKRGVRIEVICTFNADGQIAALFCVVYGLSITEMPHDEIITLDIAGLVSGGHQFLSCVEKGFISFVRGKVDEKGNLVDEHEEMSMDIMDSENNERTISKEARITKIYRDLVYYPFIDKIRRDTYGWDGEMDKNGHVPDYLTAVGWMDGANGQMSLTTGEESLKQDDERAIRQCKHSAARTGVEQMADVMAGFRIAKALNRQVTLEDVPVEMHGLKRRVSKTIATEQDEGRLKLPSHKTNAIVDFVSKLPKCAYRAFNEEIVLKGFHRNGQISVSGMIPDMIETMNTKKGGWNLPKVQNMRRSDDRDAYDKVDFQIQKDFMRKIYKRFFTTMFENGHIPESEYDKFDYPMDLNSKGEEVPKNQGISQENRQRAKVIYHVKQRELRRNLLVERENEKRRIAGEHYEKEQKIYKLNASCTELLENQLAADDGRTNSLDNRETYLLRLGEKHFGIKKVAKMFPSPDEIKAFIKVRSERTFTKDDKPNFKKVSGKRKDLIQQALSKCGTQPHQPYLSNPSNGDE